MPGVGIEVLFFQVEAVFAIEIANRPDRLGHDVEAGERHYATSLKRFYAFPIFGSACDMHFTKQ